MCLKRAIFEEKSLNLRTIFGIKIDMKLFRHISGLICWTLVAIGLTSCLGSGNDSETVVTDYYNCIVTSFSLEDNTNVCSGLSKYSFTIDNYGLSDDSIHALYPNDGIIFNPDSLPRGVIADSVKISVSFSKPDSVYLELFGLDGELGQYAQFSSDSAFYFGSYPDARMTIVARGGNRKTYHIKVNVHKVEGDTIVWHDYTDEMWADMNITDQRTDTIGQTLYWFVEENGQSYKVSTSKLSENSPTEWQAMADVSVAEGELLDLKTLYNWHNQLYAIGKINGRLMTSADGFHWEVANSGQTFVTILGNQYKTKDVYGNWNQDSLNVIVKVDDAYRFAVSADASNWHVAQQIPDNFPVTGFTRPIWTEARSNYGNLTSRLYITGGLTVSGQFVSSTWSCDGWNDDVHGPNWVEFLQDEMPGMTGTSVLEYTIDSDKPKTFWLLHPGFTATGDVPTNRLYNKYYTTLFYSEDSGVSWHRLSRYYTQYADNTSIGKVACNSAFYDPQSFRMYFFGGRRADGTFKTSVWGGCLNSLTFDKLR